MSPEFLVALDVLGDVLDALVREVVSRQLDAPDAQQPLSPDDAEDGVVHAALLDQESIQLGLLLEYHGMTSHEQLIGIIDES